MSSLGDWGSSRDRAELDAHLTNEPDTGRDAWEKHESAAYQLGEEHAKNAASWCFDGNSDVDERSRVLAMLRDGDPAAWDYLPREPNLSGEMADALTPRSLMVEIGAEDDDDDHELEQRCCDAYLEGASNAFGPACEAELIAFCEPDGRPRGTCPDCGKPITHQRSGWWTHDGLPGKCWRQSMDGPNDD